MYIDPANAAAMQVALPNKRDNFRMRNGCRLKHPFISFQQLLTPSPIADQEFAIDQVVPKHLAEIEQPIQLTHEGRAVG